MEPVQGVPLQPESRPQRPRQRAARVQRRRDPLPVPEAQPGLQGNARSWSCLRAGAWLKCPLQRPRSPRPARSAAHTEEQREVGRRLQGLEPRNLGPGGRLGPETARAGRGAAEEAGVPSCYSTFKTPSKKTAQFSKQAPPQRGRPTASEPVESRSASWALGAIQTNPREAPKPREGPRDDDEDHPLGAATGRRTALRLNPCCPKFTPQASGCLAVGRQEGA